MKKLLSVLCLIVALSVLLSVGVFAEDKNPFDIIKVAVYAKSFDDAVDILQNGIAARLDCIDIKFDKPDDIYEYTYDLAENFGKHDGVGSHGDYIEWQLGSIEWSYFVSGAYGYAEYTPEYYTTAAQEAEVDARSAQILASLGINGKSEYEKVKAIYDYICANVTYDNEHLKTPDYDLQYTCYAAMISGTSVCQGYALMFYRLCLDAGVDARIYAASSASGTGHAWNIVKIGDTYYFADTTWDAGQTKYKYFLKGTEDFSNHSEYSNNESSFRLSSLKIARTEYVPEAPAHNYETSWTTDEEYHWHKCSDCDAIKDKAAHIFDGDDDAFCNVCGYERSLEIKGDLDGDGEVTEADAIYLLFHSFFDDVYPVTQNCDFDRDGKVTDGDAIYLLFHTFFEEDYPL